MEIDLGSAFTITIITFLVSLVVGPSIFAIFGILGRAAVIMPLLLIFICGAFSIMNADPSTSASMAQATANDSINYVARILPEVVVSDVVGAIVGTFGGLIVRGLSSI